MLSRITLVVHIYIHIHAYISRFHRRYLEGAASQLLHSAVSVHSVTNTNLSGSGDKGGSEHGSGGDHGSRAHTHKHHYTPFPVSSWEEEEGTAQRHQHAFDAFGALRYGNGQTSHLNHSNYLNNPSNPTRLSPGNHGNNH